MFKFFNWKFWLGLLVSAFFIWLALRKVETAGVWQSIQSAKLPDLLLVTLIYYLQYLIRIWRWRILLEPLKETSFSNRFHATFIGFGANCVLPAHLGELVRANYLGRAERFSAGSIMGTIVVERVFDSLVLLLILIIGLAVTPFFGSGNFLFQFLRNAAILSGFILVFIIALVFFKSKTNAVITVLEKALFFLPVLWRKRMAETGRNFIKGLVPLKNVFRWAQAVFYSLLLWFSGLIQVALIGHALGLGLPFSAGFMIMALSALSVLVPSAPGYIGTFHYVVKFGFILYGIPEAKALSAATLLHATTYFPTLLLGLISFFYMQKALGRKPDERVIL
ncbi:MAG: lysylphosphatidylglycerol synthase transmembrane domain-containing protein [Deltaproteobacteria bacterium]|nr:lysylphosphatidylglycerol synthase transmembrane domain-containing protein [Deltaproteobacteria bacterium]